MAARRTLVLLLLLSEKGFTANLWCRRESLVNEIKIEGYRTAPIHTNVCLDIRSVGITRPVPSTRPDEIPFITEYPEKDCCCTIRTYSQRQKIVNPINGGRSLTVRYKHIDTCECIECPEAFYAVVPSTRTPLASLKHKRWTPPPKQEPLWSDINPLKWTVSPIFRQDQMNYTTLVI